MVSAGYRANHQKSRTFATTIGNTDYAVIVEESENAKETITAKIKKLIDRNYDRIIFEQRQIAIDTQKPLEG